MIREPGGKNQTNIISVGIFEKSSRKFRSWCRRNVRSGWKVVVAIGKDYRKVHPNKDKSISAKIITHYFLISTPSILHVAVIFPGSDFFWIANVEETVPPEYRYLANLTFSIPLPMAVDTFDCDRVSTFRDQSFVRICIPEDLGYYLWQIPMAKFYECHYEDIVYPFWGKHNMQGKDNLNLNQEIAAIREMMRISREIRVLAMIYGGSLLGWYRQCNHS